MSSTPTTVAPEKLLLTLREAASALGVCTRKLYLLKHEGKLKFVKVGKSTRITPEELRRFVSAL